MTKLDGLWRFHAGDNPAWADARFDDASWALLRSDETWVRQGYADLSGLAWYRVQVIPAQGAKSLALLIPAIGHSYQVFAGGEMIGQSGGMPPHAYVVIAGNQVVRVPDGLVHPGEPLVIAIRVWAWPIMEGRPVLGLRAAPFIGDPDTVAERRHFELQRLYWQETDTNLLLLVNLVTAVLGLVLFALRRSEREYLWYGAAQIVWTAATLVSVAGEFVRQDYVPAFAISLIGSRAGAFLNLEFFLALLRKPRRIAYWVGALSVLSPILLFCRVG